MRDTERAQLARELVPVRRGLRREALPQLAAAGVDASCRPVSGSTSQRSPTSGSSCSRGSRISIATTSCRAASRSSRGRQSRGPRKSETTTTTERRRVSRPIRASAVAERGRPGRLEVRLAPQRDQERQQAAASLPGGRGAGCRSPNVASAEPVAASRGEVADRERDALGDVPLAPVGGAEGHRRRRVEQQPRLDRPLGDVHAHVRLAGARGDVPVDQPDVVAEDVRPHLRELGAVAEAPRSGGRRRAGRRCAGARSGSPCAAAPRRRRRGRDARASERD